MAYLDDYSTQVIRQDHETLADIAHPQSNKNTTGKPSPTIPETTFMILCLPGTMDSDKYYEWKNVAYNTTSKAWVTNTAFDSTSLGKAVSLSECQLLIRASTTDGNPINVLIGGSSDVGLHQGDVKQMITDTQSGWGLALFGP